MLLGRIMTFPGRIRALKNYISWSLLAYGAAERLCNSNSDLVFESLAVAEGQGDNNHFYKKYFQIQELLGNSRDFKSQQAGIYIA